MRHTRVRVLMIFSLLMIAVLLSQSKAEAAMTARNWYKQVLNGSTGDTIKIGSKKYDLSQFGYYKAVDINKDGIKELLLSTTPRWYLKGDGTDKVVLVTYYKGKVKGLKVFTCPAGGGLLYRSSTKTLTHYIRYSDMAQSTIYQLRSGTLKKTMILKNSKKYSNKKGYYWQGYKNGKKCSVSTLKKYWKTYFDKASEVKYTAF